MIKHAIVCAALCLTACDGGQNPVERSAEQDPLAEEQGPLMGEAAVAALQKAFHIIDADGDGQICQSEIDATSISFFAGLNSNDDGVLDANDPDIPMNIDGKYYSQNYDMGADGTDIEEFKAGEYAAAKVNVDTSGDGCVSFQEMKAFQEL